MAYRLDIQPEAQNDIDEIFSWYEGKHISLSYRFIDELTDHFGIILQNPYQSQDLAQGVRKLSLKKFPYKIIYKIYGSDVVVIAIIHHKRRPGLWRKRI